MENQTIEELRSEYEDLCQRKSDMIDNFELNTARSAKRFDNILYLEEEKYDYSWWNPIRFLVNKEKRNEKLQKILTKLIKKYRDKQNKRRAKHLEALEKLEAQLSVLCDQINLLSKNNEDNQKVGQHEDTIQY